MKLVDAKCTNCGAVLKVDSAKDAAICEHCGSAYIVEKAVNYYQTQNINANVVNIFNNDRIEKRWKEKIEDAKNEISLGDYDNALEIYRQISVEYPREYIIWKEYVLCFFEKIKKLHKFSVYWTDSRRAGDVRNLKEVIRRAKASCPKENLDSLVSCIDNFFKGIYDDTLNGSFEFLSFYSEHYSLEANLQCISQLHPLMKKIADDCISITNKLKNMRIHFGYPAHVGEISFWSDNLIPNGMSINPIQTFALIGRECIWYYMGHPYSDDNRTFRSKLPITATDDRAFYEEVKRISLLNLQNVAICPFCERGTIKNKMFGGRVCSTCKQYIPDDI